MRLIDAEEVANCYERMMKNLDEKNALPEQITEFAVAREYLQWASYVINNTPTVDAVEVVRCKDCIDWDTSWTPIGTEQSKEEMHFCPVTGTISTENHFCSYGERREK